MNIIRVFMVIMLLTAAVSAAALAEDATISVTPGKYSIKKETSSNLHPEPVINTDEKCITDKVFNPVESLPSKEHCTATNVKKKGNTVNFDVVCDLGPDMSPFKGTAEFSSNGVGIAWKIVMNGEADGKGFTVNSKAEGKRIGACK